MATWFKVDTAFLQNDRILKAGTDGAIVFLQLLAINARNSQDGTIAPGKAEPSYLATLLQGLHAVDDHEIMTHVVGEALESLETAGLIERDESGLRLVGFDATWKPPYTDAERAKRYRAARRKGAHIDPVTEPRDAQSQPNVTDPEKPSRTVTPYREIDREIERESTTTLSSISSPVHDAPEAGSEEADQAPVAQGKIEQREEKIGKDGRSLLKIMRGHGILARKQHALLDLVEKLQAAEWTDETLRWAIEKTQATVTAGSWQATFVKKAEDNSTRDLWLQSFRAYVNELSVLDHHFDTSVDERIKEEAPAEAEREDLQEWQAYERLIAGRYASFIGSGDSRNAKGDPWIIDDVPIRYRRHLNKDGSGLIAPLELQPFGKGTDDRTT